MSGTEIQQRVKEFAPTFYNIPYIDIHINDLEHMFSFNSSGYNILKFLIIMIAVRLLSSVDAKNFLKWLDIKNRTLIYNKFRSSSFFNKIKKHDLIDFNRFYYFIQNDEIYKKIYDFIKNNKITINDIFIIFKYVITMFKSYINEYNLISNINYYLKLLNKGYDRYQLSYIIIFSNKK